MTRSPAPLSRSTVTLGSRVMLPTYPAFALYIGFVYATDPAARLAGSSAFPLLPTAVWGAGFVTAGAVLVAALLVGRRSLYVFSLSPLLLWLLVWAAALGGNAAVADGSFSAPAFPAFIAVTCWATMLSLASRETS